MDLSLASFVDDLLGDVWFQLTLLLVVSLIASFLFARFGQPKVIGFILVGVAIGLLRHEDGDTSGLPESLKMLASLGAIVLLFMIGLECDLREIYTKKSIAIATGGVVLPWLGGFLLAEAMGYGGTESIFIGATLVATSVAITASVTSELGLIGTPVAYAIVGAAVVDDVLGMLVLGISKGLAVDGLDPIWLVLVVIAAIVFVIAGAWIGSKLLVRMVFDVQVSGFRRKLPMSGFILALAIAFIYAFVAETIGLSAVVGAFVAGTAFSTSVLRDGFRKGTQYLEALFVPLFFVSLGIAVDIHGISSALGFALALTAVAFVTKIVGAGLPAKWFGMSRWDSAAVGIGMTPRMEIAIIIAYVGISSDPPIIDSEVYSVIVFMAIVTALFAPTLLKSALKRAGHTLLN